MSWGRPFYTLTARERPTVGDSKFSAVPLDHMGWLLCDGRNVLVKDYYFLYQVIGYSYGSNTSNDFNIPNMSGRIPGALGQAGSGNNYSGSNWALGQSTGTEYHTLTVAEMPTHSHFQSTFTSTTGVYLTDPQHRHTGTTEEGGYARTSTEATPLGGGAADDTSGGHTHNFTTTSNSTGITLTDPGHIHRIADDGGSNRHNNMQPTTYMGNMFIYSGKTNYASKNFPYKPFTNLY